MIPLLVWTFCWVKALEAAEFSEQFLFLIKFLYVRFSREAVCPMSTAYLILLGEVYSYTDKDLSPVTRPDQRADLCPALGL